MTPRATVRILFFPTWLDGGEDAGDYLRNLAERDLVEGERPGRRPGTGRRMSLGGGVDAGHRELKALTAKMNAQAA